MEDNTNTQPSTATDQTPGQFEAQGFHGEPLKKVGTATTEPVLATGGTEPLPIVTGTTATTTATPAAVTTATEPPPDVFTKLKEAGYDINDEDTILQYLHSGRELQTKITEYETKARNYDSLDTFALDVDRAKKAGMDIDLYLDARKMDVDKLDVKESLRREFFLKNQQLVADEPVFAGKKFEKEYQAKYGILDKKFADELEKAEAAEEIDFAQRNLNVDAIAAKRYLQEFKQKNITIPDVAPQSQAPSQEDSQRIFEEYQSQAESFADSMQTFSITIDNKEFNYGLENYRSEIKEELKDVVNTLRNIGVDLETGKIDAELLGEFLAYPKIVDNLKPVIDFAIEQRNAELVTTKVAGIAPTQSMAGGSADPQLTEAQRIGQAFAAKRAAERASSY